MAVTLGPGAAEARRVAVGSRDYYGLIYAFLIEPHGPVHDLGPGDIEAALDLGVLWLHFDGANSHARTWIADWERLPQDARERLLEDDDRCRADRYGAGIVGVVSDLHYNFDFDPDHIGSLRFYLDAGVIVSLRREPLSASDGLRRALRGGLDVGGTGTLLATIFQCQAETLEGIAARLARELAQTEDQVLAGRRQDQRSQLGRLRRLAVRLHRSFAPVARVLRRLGRNLPHWIDDAEHTLLREAAEAFAEVVDDLEAMQEQAKLLQEELVARTAEETGRNLFLLSIVTAVFMPLTLITGIFGMNVAGLPGLQDGTAFAWVMLGMVVVGVVTLVVLRRNRIL